MIGTDILYIPRLKKIIETYPNFIKKVYTEKEISIAESLNNPLEFYATRFVAKEAIIKATDGKYDFKEIEILKKENGKPFPIVDNLNIELSLSYDNEYAIGFCLIK